MKLSHRPTQHLPCYFILLTLFFIGAPAAAQTTPAAPEEPTVSVDGPSDQAIAQRLREVYTTIPGLEEVQVGVDGGVAQLSGTTRNATDRENAVSLAERIEGVIYVVDNLEQETNLRKTLAPALERIQSYLTDIVAYLPLLLVALLILFLFILLARLISTWEAPFRRLGVNPLLQNLLKQLVRAVVIIVGLLVALDILGATAVVTAVLGTAGVAGVAIGFAFRDIVENYLAGILMSVRQPFAVNDLIKLEDYEGKVIRLTSRDMVLMTLDGNHVRIPNATIFNGVITNYTRNPRRQFNFTVGVDVEEDLSYVQSLGIEALRAMTGVMNDPTPFARVEELGDFNVIVRFFGWVDQRHADYYKVRSEAVRIVKAALDEADVLMPEPITNVRLQRVPESMSLEAASPDEAEKQTSPKPAPHTLSALEQGTQGDVSVDRQLDAQIEEELASDEPNLLEDER